MKKTLLIVFLVALVGVSAFAEKQSKYKIIFQPAQTANIVNVNVCVCAGSILEDAENRGLAAVGAWFIFDSPTSGELAGLFDILSISRSVELTPNWLVVKYSCRIEDVKRLSDALAEVLFNISVTSKVIADLPKEFSDVSFPLTNSLSDFFPTNGLICYPPKVSQLKEISHTAYNRFFRKYFTRNNTTVVYSTAVRSSSLERDFERTFFPLGAKPSMQVDSFSPKIVVGAESNPQRAVWKSCGWLLPVENPSNLSNLFCSVFQSYDLVGDKRRLLFFQLGSFSYCAIFPNSLTAENDSVPRFLHTASVSCDYIAAKAINDLQEIVSSNILAPFDSATTLSNGFSLSLLNTDRRINRRSLLEFLEMTSLNLRNFQPSETFTPWEISDNVKLWFKRVDSDRAEITVLGSGFSNGFSLKSSSVAKSFSVRTGKEATSLITYLGMEITPIGIGSWAVQSFPMPFGVKISCRKEDVPKVIRLICERIPNLEQSKDDSMERKWQDLLFSNMWKGKEKLLSNAHSIERLDIFVATPERVLSIAVPSCKICPLLGHLGVPEPMLKTEKLVEQNSTLSGMFVFCSSQGTANFEYSLTALHLLARNKLKQVLPSDARIDGGTFEIGKGAITSLGVLCDSLQPEELSLQVCKVWEEIRMCELDDFELVEINNELATWILNKQRHKPFFLYFSAMLFPSKRGGFLNVPIPQLDRFSLRATAKNFFCKDVSTLRLYKK